MNIVGRYFLQNLPNFDDTCLRLFEYVEEREIIIFYHFEQNNVFHVFQIAVLTNSVDGIYDVYGCDIPCHTNIEAKQIIKEFVLELFP